ncbi:MAG TPA: acyltransferase, partial [Coprobacter fastidiosus]|nr:acyltransferase [Coprobacter fastidiosus]
GSLLFALLVVTAGAVVTKPFPFSRVLIGGIPASEIKKI